MALNSPAFCSASDLDNYLSAAGIIAFADHDQSGTSDTDVVNQAINRATSTILNYAGQQYTAADLATNQTIKDWCVVIACYVICGLRGNPRPESLSEDYQEIIAWLKEVRSGNYQIYGLAKRGGKAPAFANITIDRGYPNRKQRVKPNSSNPQRVPQTDDVVYPEFDYP